MRSCCAWVLVFICGLTSLGRAQGTQHTVASENTPEELAAVMARRVSSHLGQPVHIKDLRYELLTSRFVGQQIEVGPRGAPILELDQISIKPRFLPGGEGGQVIEQLQVSGARATFPSSWMDRPLPQNAGRGVRLFKGQILGTRITVLAPGGARVILRDLKLMLNNLNIPLIKGKKNIAWGGAFVLEADSVNIEELTLSNVRIEGAFSPKKIEIILFTGEIVTALGQGTFNFKGALGFEGQRLGALDLVGKADLRAQSETGPHLRGPIFLKGRSWGKAQLLVKLKSDQKIAASQGSMKPAPLIQLRGRVGQRTLQGTLESWRLR